MEEGGESRAIYWELVATKKGCAAINSTAASSSSSSSGVVVVYCSGGDGGGGGDELGVGKAAVYEVHVYDCTHRLAVNEVKVRTFGCLTMCCCCFVLTC